MQNFTCPGIVYIPSVGTLLVHLKHLKTGTVGYEVAQVHGVSVAVTSGVKQLAVIVYGRRTIDYLVATVAINVANRQVVVAVTVDCVAAGAACSLLGSYGLGVAVGICQSVRGL